MWACWHITCSLGKCKRCCRIWKLWFNLKTWCCCCCSSPCLPFLSQLSQEASFKHLHHKFCLQMPSNLSKLIFSLSSSEYSRLLSGCPSNNNWTSKDKYLSNDVTLRNFEDRPQLVGTRENNTVQTTHCPSGLNLEKIWIIGTSSIYFGRWRQYWSHREKFKCIRQLYY